MARRGLKAYRRAQDIRRALGVDTGIEYPMGFDKTSAREAVKAMSLGATPRAACVASGISLRDYEGWIARGAVMAERVRDEGLEPVNMQDKDRVVHAFYTMVMTALAKAAVKCGHRMAKDPDWRSKAWMMEKVYKPFLEPESAPLAPVGPDGKPVQSQVVVYVPDNKRSTR